MRRGFSFLWRSAFLTVLLLVLTLTVVQVALPTYLRSYVNRTLDESPDYDGRVGSIEVNLWRGAYAIRDLTIVKTTNAVPVPFFESPRVDFSLDWNSLLHGRARGKVRMEKPRLNFVQGPSPDETQTGADQPWLDILDELFPFRIDKTEVVDGRIHFQTFHTDPKVNVYLSDVQATVTNLTNVTDSLDPLIATVQATGTAMHSGQLEFHMSLDPNAHRPTFDLVTRLIDLDVTKVNSLTRAYGDFDFESGRFDLVVELSVKDGFLQGYAKPLFRDLVILSVRDIQTKDPLQVFWEALVGIVGELFQNQARSQFGTKITLEGDYDNPRTSLLEIIGNVLRNAFVRAYLPRVEGRVAPREATRDTNESR